MVLANGGIVYGIRREGWLSGGGCWRQWQLVIAGCDSWELMNWRWAVGMMAVDANISGDFGCGRFEVGYGNGWPAGVLDDKALSP